MRRSLASGAAPSPGSSPAHTTALPAPPALPRALPTLAATLLLALPLSAQEQTPPEERMRMYEAHEAMLEASPFQRLPWQFVGPTNISGRMTDVDVVTPKGESYTIYVAGASGGVWKTENEGVTWEPVFEHGPSTSIGDVTLDPTNPEVVWVGTGEANIFRSSMAGAGVFRSADGGETWEHKGLVGTHTIARIVVDPTDPDVVWVAASGHEWTENEERGVYRSTDGGDTWEKVLYVDERTGAIDLVMDPRDPDRLYAATWERTRLRWNDPRNLEGYDGSGIWRTDDGGESWVRIDEGLPAPEHRGRIGIDVARSNPDVLYAFVDNYEVARMPEEGELNAYGLPRAPVIKGATVYRSDDRGGSWRRVSEENRYMESLSATYGWVFGQIRVDPNDEDTIYVMGIRLNRSTDGGKTFEALCCMHVDHHGLFIDPANSDYLVNTNDGGVDISYDGGESWRAFNDDGLTLVQFFNVAVDMGEPVHVYGSIQDHGSFRGVLDTSRGRHAVRPTGWERAPGGEGSIHQIDPTDPDVVYSAGFYGRISRSELEEEESERIVPEPPEGELPYRGQWLAPFVLSPHNPRVVYLGLNHLFRSMHMGESWKVISPDLSYDDPGRYGDIPFQTIFSIAEDPFEFGRLWAGTDDGRLWRTDDSGDSWTELGLDLPRGLFIAEIVASQHEPGRVYMVQNGKRNDDFRPHVWASEDYGETWESIAGGVPSGPVNVIEEDPESPDVLYLGTDLSAYVSLDRGGTWHALAGDLPSTFVQDMVVHPRDDILVAATHGRGVFAMDVRPIQQLTPEVMASALHLFRMEPAGPGRTLQVPFWSSGEGDATVTVRNADGEVVREIATEVGRGFNAVVWDLRPGREEAEEEPTPRFGRRGGTVPAGTYTVEVARGGASVSREVEIGG